MAFEAIEPGESVQLGVDFVHVVGIRHHVCRGRTSLLGVEVVYVQNYSFIVGFFHF